MSGAFFPFLLLGDGNFQRRKLCSCHKGTCLKSLLDVLIHDRGTPHVVNIYPSPANGICENICCCCFFSHPNSSVSTTIALGLLLNCQSRNLGNDLLTKTRCTIVYYWRKPEAELDIAYWDLDKALIKHVISAFSRSQHQVLTLITLIKENVMMNLWILSIFELRNEEINVNDHKRTWRLNSDGIYF